MWKAGINTYLESSSIYVPTCRTEALTRTLLCKVRLIKNLLKFTILLNCVEGIPFTTCKWLNTKISLNVGFIKHREFIMLVFIIIFILLFIFIVYGT